MELQILRAGHSSGAGADRKVQRHASRAAAVRGTQKDSVRGLQGRRAHAQHPGLHASVITMLSVRSSTLRSEEHTSELQSHLNLVCRLLLEKKKKPISLHR